MNYRMLELIAPKDTCQSAREVIEREEHLGIWTNSYHEGYTVLRVLINMDDTETLSDTLTDKFSDADGFRIMIFSVEATLPQPEIAEEELTDKEESSVERVSREELYANVSSGSRMTWVFLVSVFFSTVVAGFGLITNDVAVIIGAMVITPLLGPNVAMSLAVTLGDLKLGLRSLKANGAGLSIALLISYIMGAVFIVDPETAQILSRTEVGLTHISIGLAAGSAGVLAYTEGVPAPVIGVMMAIALLPALASGGLLLGAGYYELALGALILTVTNLICINLSGVLTFLAQGIRPRTWWETKKAKKAIRIGLAIWFVLLVIFATLIFLWEQAG